MILFRYKWRTGFISWAVHRLTGIALVLYLFLHLYILSNLRDPGRFETVMGLMRNPLVKVGELGLLALVAAHALNGARVTLLELGMPTRLHKPVFWGGAVCLAILLAIGGVVFLGGGQVRFPGTIGWLFHRLAGAFLFFGLILHFYVMHFAGAQNVTYEAVMARYTSPWWIGFDATFLACAIYHGFNGLWGIGLEYVQSSSALRVLRLSLLATGCVLAIVGIYILTLG